MAAARWGKSSGAYKKFNFIFSKPLPVVVMSNATLSDAVVLRDVIAYAKEHGLPGGNWYKKVTVSPQDNGTVIIKVKPAFAPELASIVVKEYTLFSLMHAIDRHEIGIGDRCHCADDVEDLNAALANKGIYAQVLGGSLMELMELQHG